MKVICKN